MPKTNRGGKRVPNVLPDDNSETKQYGPLTERRYYTDFNGNKHYEGEDENGDEWKLLFGAHTDEEKEDGEWLQGIIGERVYLNPEVDKPDGNRSADYVTESGVLIDRKKPKSPDNRISRLVEQGKGQTTTFLINVTGTTKTDEEIEKEVDAILHKLPSTTHAKTIYIKKGNEFIGKYSK